MADSQSRMALLTPFDCVICVTFGIELRVGQAASTLLCMKWLLCSRFRYFPHAGVTGLSPHPDGQKGFDSSVPVFLLMNTYLVLRYASDRTWYCWLHFFFFFKSPSSLTPILTKSFLRFMSFYTVLWPGPSTDMFLIVQPVFLSLVFLFLILFFLSLSFLVVFDPVSHSAVLNSTFWLS